MKLQKIWAREYSNGVHFSTVKKDGFTAFVPEQLALAMFLRAQLELLGPEVHFPNGKKIRPRKPIKKKAR